MARAPIVTRPPTTPDGRYLVVRGRLWRASDPGLDAAERERLVQELMRLRNRIGQAKRRGDRDEEQAARRHLHEVKVALGERGPPWWTDGAPDHDRHLVHNTPYRGWFESLTDGTGSR
jgi:hypothetical protein